MIMCTLGLIYMSCLHESEERNAHAILSKRTRLSVSRTVCSTDSVVTCLVYGHHHVPHLVYMTIYVMVRTLVVGADS